MEIDDFNVSVPSKIMAQLVSHKRKRKRGYPEQIDDDRLWGVRQHMVSLLEITWDEVGWRLPSVRTMAGLRRVMTPWERRVDQEEHVVKALLRNTQSKATSRLLYRQRKQLGELHERFLRAAEWIGKCRDTLERFIVIPRADLSPAEQTVVSDAIYERARILARAGEECITLRDQEKELDDLIRDGEAYFAREEFLQLCRSRLYSLTPLNVANALAGLPFIACRRSAKRCRKWPGVSGGLSYGIFCILERIVGTNIRTADLIRDAEKWLRARRPGGETLAVADLRENWYYLRRSISAVLEQGTGRAQRTAAISRQYWKRKSNPSAIDSAFAEEESIVM